MNDNNMPFTDGTTPVVDNQIPVENTETNIQEPVINTPIEPYFSNETPVNNINNNNKKKISLKLILIIVGIVLVLGIGGYFLYDKVINKPDIEEEPKVEYKEQVIKVKDDSYRKGYVDSKTHELGTIEIDGDDYTISFVQSKCTDTSKCSQFLTLVIISNGEDTDKGIYIADGGVKEIALLDGRFLFINTGMSGDRPLYTDSMFVLDYYYSFEEVLSINKYLVNNYEGFSDNTIGYVDKNTIRVGTCTAFTANQKCSNTYKEYLIKFKDDTIEVIEDYIKENIKCTSKC